MSAKEVEEMPFSRFSKDIKAARMIRASDALLNLRIVSWPHIEARSDRDAVWRELKHASTEFMETKVKDFREVMGNIAKRMLGRGG